MMTRMDEPALIETVAAGIAPIAKRIVEEHGGALALAAAPRQGTIARITLPARAG